MSNCIKNCLFVCLFYLMKKKTNKGPTLSESVEAE